MAVCVILSDLCTWTETLNCFCDSQHGYLLCLRHISLIKHYLDELGSSAMGHGVGRDG